MNDTLKYRNPLHMHRLHIQQCSLDAPWTKEVLQGPLISHLCFERPHLVPGRASYPRKMAGITCKWGGTRANRVVCSIVPLGWKQGAEECSQVVKETGIQGDGAWVSEKERDFLYVKETEKEDGVWMCFIFINVNMVV